MEIKELYSLFLKSGKVCTDTRNIIDGSVFFALKGESFNGNKFAEQALAQGCSYAVIDEPEYKKDDRYITVEDSLHTLQQLAAYHRSKLTIPVIGITGTNGKTTTKELIHAVLSEKFKTHATSGNFNNHIGVPLTVLSIPKDTEIAIIEMGANHPGEIAFLTEISQPDYGIITNIGKAHLEGFGSFEGVINTKKELYDYIRKHNGKIFINDDDNLLKSISEGMDRFSYGTDDAVFSKGKYLQSSPYMVMELHSDKGVLYVRSKLIGKYNFYNAMAAACIGRYFGVDDLTVKNAIEKYTPSNNRSQLTKTEKNIIIADSYNANPSSMQAAIGNFCEMKAADKALILGDMLELGATSREEHDKIIELLIAKNCSNVYLVGRNFKDSRIQHNFNVFDDTDALIRHLQEININNNTILIKGSRGIKLERCIDIL